MRPIVAPLRSPEIHARLVDLAGEYGLDASGVDLAPYLPRTAARASLHAPRVAAAIIESALADLRASAGRYRLLDLPDGAVAIVVDPVGDRDNLEAVVARLRDASEAAYRAAAVADTEARPDVPLRIIAHRWRRSERTLRRWRREAGLPSRRTGQSHPPMSGRALEPRDSMVA